MTDTLGSEAQGLEIIKTRRKGDWFALVLEWKESENGAEAVEK